MSRTNAKKLSYRYDTMGAKKTSEWADFLICLIVFQTKESLRYDIENYVPVESLIQGKALLPNVNILLMGPIGAGKSSFYNTIHAVLQDRIFNVARSGSTDQSLTMKVSLSGFPQIPLPHS